MRIVKSTFAAFVAVASLAFVAGCGDDKGDTSGGSTPSASPSPSKSVSATDRFAEAAELVRGTPYKFNVKGGGVTYEGSSNPLAGIVIGKLTAQITVEGQLSPSEYLLKFSGLPLPGFDGSKWFKVDPEKLTSPDAVALGDHTDPTGLQSLADAVGTVESTDGKQFKGTFDFTKATWGPVDDDAVKALGDKAKAVPFEATADDQGHLTSLKITVPAFGSEKEQVYTSTYSDFGTQVQPASPSAADVIEAPDALYTLLNSR